MGTVAVPVTTKVVRERAIQQKLLVRRERLQQALTTPQRTDHLQGLLDEIDAALARMEEGTFGICETCHDHIEADRILTDPLARNCLDHLSPAEQRTLERDLDLAYQVQHGLLPKPGRAGTGWSLAYHYEPAGPVSGDYCDLIPLDDGSALFLLGDVSGKGVAASMMMTQLHAIFRSLGATNCHVPELVARANRIFCEGTIFSFFATLACGKLTPTGSVEVCNAGHCYPLHVHRGQVTPLKTTGLPLGLFNDGEYGCQTVQLHPGDSLVLYTDGLSEAFDPSGNQYGAGRLSQLLMERGNITPAALVELIVADVKKFRGSGPKTDDLTVMVLRRD
jgi:phosphoserine phosphatase RsbU/P